MIQKISVNSSKKMQMLDITEELQKWVSSSGIKEGLCVVYVPHTTAGVTINENTDPDVQRDMMLGLERMIPDEDYKHFEFNSPSHMLSSIVGASETLIIEQGRPILGRWQAVYLCEFDGPKTREIYIKTY